MGAESKKGGNPELAMRQAMERVDITDTIRAIKNGTFVPNTSLSELEHTLVHPTNPIHTNLDGFELAKHIWEKTKIERNASIAIFSEEIWESFAHARETIPQIFMSETPISIRNYTRNIFNGATRVWSEYRDKRIDAPSIYWDELDLAYARLSSIIAFGDRNSLSDNRSNAGLITRGIGTAATVTWGVILLTEHLAQKYEIPKTKETILPIIEKAYGPIILALASMHMQIAVPIIDCILADKRTLDSSFFSLTRKGNTWKLGFDHAALYEIKNHNGQPILEHNPSSENTWCPGRYAQGAQKDVIREYFEWSLYLYEQAYYK